jgi:hypothetical protein
MPCQPYLSEGCRLFILNGRDYWHYSTLVAAGETARWCERAATTFDTARGACKRVVGALLGRHWLVASGTRLIVIVMIYS